MIFKEQQEKNRQFNCKDQRDGGKLSLKNGAKILDKVDKNSKI